MKLCSFLLFLSLLLVSCAPAEAPDPTESGEIPHVGPPEGFQTAENFDPDDVRWMRENRDRWSAAFAAGDPGALEFVFEQDAVIELPEVVRNMTAVELFGEYSAKLTFDESSEQFITDGGDPRVMTKLPWVSYYGDYELNLTPRSGGEPIGSTGTFMTRFHRQPDGSLEVIRGPALGESAPRFGLNEMATGEEIELEELLGERPVVLVFGSYT